MNLKHCPFCGFKSVRFDDGAEAMICNECGVVGPEIDYMEHGRGEAARLWNKRTPIWTEIGDELPDDELTVLITNDRWSDPVDFGYHAEGVWHSSTGFPLNTPLGKPNPNHHPETEPPTHWMHLPEPPNAMGTVGFQPASGGILPPSETRPSDYRVAYPNNPFAVEGGITCGVEDCCRMIKSFSAMQCLDALALPNNGKVVTKALQARLRAIEKQNRKAPSK